MRGFSKFFNPKLWTAVGTGIGVSAFAIQSKEFGGFKAYCESFSWDPNTPINIPSGYPKWDYDWDKRQPYSLVPKGQGKGDAKAEEKYHEQLEKNKCKATRTLYLIRVGDYDPEKPECEHTLTSVGFEQALLVGQRLKEIAKKKDITFTSIVCSRTKVAEQTAEIISNNIGQKNFKISDKDPLLSEGCPSLPEPPSPSIYPEPKSLYSDGSRIEAAFRKYFYRADPQQENDSFEIIVCDANVIRYFLCRAMQFPAQGWLRMMLAHASINVVSINPKGNVVLRAVGESGFMPPEKLTA